MSHLVSSTRVKQVKIDSRLHTKLKIEAARRHLTLRAHIEELLNFVPAVAPAKERKRFKREKESYGK